jgi:hypothetical protein
VWNEFDFAIINPIFVVANRPKIRYIHRGATSQEEARSLSTK